MAFEEPQQKKQFDDFIEGINAPQETMGKYNYINT